MVSRFSRLKEPSADPRVVLTLALAGSILHSSIHAVLQRHLEDSWPSPSKRSGGHDASRSAYQSRSITTTPPILLRFMTSARAASVFSWSPPSRKDRPLDSR